MNPKNLITLGLVGVGGYLLAVRFGIFDGFDLGAVLPDTAPDPAATDAAAGVAAAEAARLKAAADAAAAAGNAAAAEAIRQQAAAAAVVAAAAAAAAEKARADKAAADAAAANLPKNKMTFAQYVDSLGIWKPNYGKFLSADSWNYYYSAWSGIPQTTDLFTEGSRDLEFPLEQYMIRRASAGLSGFGRYMPTTAWPGRFPVVRAALRTPEVEFPIARAILERDGFPILRAAGTPEIEFPKARALAKEFLERRAAARAGLGSARRRGPVFRHPIARAVNYRRRADAGGYVL